MYIKALKVLIEALLDDTTLIPPTGSIKENSNLWLKTKKCVISTFVISNNVRDLRLNHSTAMWQVLRYTLGDF